MLLTTTYVLFHLTTTFVFALEDKLSGQDQLSNISHGIEDDIKASGVINLGQTCWFATVLQMFFHTDVAQRIINEPVARYNNTLLTKLKSTLTHMKVEQLPINPRPLIEALEFSKSAQDVHEMWEEFLDSLVEKLPVEFKIHLKESFNGRYTSIKSYSNNCTIYNIDEPFSTISMTVNRYSNLTMAMDEFTSKHGGGQYFPSWTSKCLSKEFKMFGNITKYKHYNWTYQWLLTPNQMPRYFVIHLKRFLKWEMEQEMESRFTFPKSIDLSKYIFNSSNTHTFQYQLHGIVEYERWFYDDGVGHYRYYARSNEKELDGVQDYWMRYDDENMSWVWKAASILI